MTDDEGNGGRFDWKTRAILFLGALLIAAWLFLWGLNLVGSGRTVSGSILLFLAVVALLLPRIIRARLGDDNGWPPMSP